MRENTLRENLSQLVSRMHAAGISYAEAVGQFERQFLLEVVAQHKGNQCKAAKTLGMHYNTLNRKLMSFGMNSGEIHRYLRGQPSDIVGDPNLCSPRFRESACGDKSGTKSFGIKESG